MLELYDGGKERKSLKIDRFCNKRAPYLCLHAEETGYNFRPCRIGEEAYLSSQESFIIKFASRRGSFFGRHDFYFKLRYEFVNAYQEGDAIKPNSNDCVRIIKSTGLAKGSFSPPNNILFYGPGGHSQLDCSYTFIGRPDESIIVTVQRLRLGQTKCKTLFNSTLLRYECKYSDEPRNELIIADGRDAIPRECFCEDLEQIMPFTSFSVTNVVQVNFTVEGIQPWQYYKDYQFQGQYQFAPKSGCGEYRFTGQIGEFNSSAYTNNLRSDVTCRWTIEVEFGKYVYLNFTYINFAYPCDDERILIFAPRDPHPGKILCRENLKNINDAFSKHWHSDNYFSEDSNRIIIEYVSLSEGGEFHARWLQIAKPSPISRYWEDGTQDDHCGFICPGVNACIDNALMCDGVADCPGAYYTLSSPDETEKICGKVEVKPFPWLYVALSSGFGGLVVLISVVWLIDCLVKGCMKRRNKKRMKANQKQTFELFNEYSEGEFKTTFSKNWE